MLVFESGLSGVCRLVLWSYIVVVVVFVGFGRRVGGGGGCV